MAKAEASVEELVGRIECGELRLTEMQRHYAWRSTHVRDLLDSPDRGYPSGAVQLWETDEAVPLQEFAVQQQDKPKVIGSFAAPHHHRMPRASGASMPSLIHPQPATQELKEEPVAETGRIRRGIKQLESATADRIAVNTSANRNYGKGTDQ